MIWLWLIVWLMFGLPRLAGDDVLGLSGWGIALVICIILDLLD